MEIDRYTDREIVSAILARDASVTKDYLYGKCWPMFKSVYDRYYTDCAGCFEFINEIYVYIMSPRRDTGLPKLSTFGFRCTLTTWLKIVCENFCHQLYARRLDTGECDEEKIVSDDFIEEKARAIDRHDVGKILASMPNSRYRRLIEYRYIEEKTNEETAALLGLTMDNYYNTHRRAKAQFRAALRKEGLL